MATMEESDNATALKKAYTEMILNTAKESAVKVMVSNRKAARFHHDLCGTKEESLRLHAQLKQMIDDKTIEAEIRSSNQQRKIDLLEAQLQEAEDIIIDLRSELRWVRDELEKARKAHNVVVYKEQETISAQKVADLEVVVGSVDPNQERSESDSFLNQSSLVDECCCGGMETITAQKKIDDVEVVVGSVDLNQERSESDSFLNRSSLVDDECGGGKEIIAAAEVVASLRPDQEDAVMSDSVLNQSSLLVDECGGGKETISAVEAVANLHPNQEDAVMSDSLLNQSSLLDDICGGSKETISAAEVVASLRPSQDDAVMSDSLLNQSSLFDDGCGENGEKQFDGLSVEASKVCESELDADVKSDSFKNQSSLHDDECGGKETISVAEVVASVHPDQDDAVMSDCLLNQSSLFDDGCGGNGEKQFDGLNVETSKACESESDTDNRSDSFKNRSSLHGDECGGKETISVAEVVASVHPDQEDAVMSDFLLNQSSLFDDGCGGNGEKQFDGLSVETSKACESELDADIRRETLELTRNGCTQRIHANEDERHTADKDSAKNLSSGHETGSTGNTRSLVLALRASNAEVIPIKPSNNSLRIKKSRKSKGRRKTRWGKRKATLVRSQSQLIKHCQSDSDIPCSKTSVEDSVVQTTKMGSELVTSCSDWKATAVVSDEISEYWRANRDRLLKYTYHRKRKRGSLKENDDNNYSPWKRKETMHKIQLNHL